MVKDIAIRMKTMTRNFNRFRSGSETIYEMIGMPHWKYDAICNGEMGLEFEYIDKLVSMGYSLNWIAGSGDPSVIEFEDDGAEK